MNFADMTSAHFIFIPAVLLVGIVIGWVLGRAPRRDAYRGGAEAPRRTEDARRSRYSLEVRTTASSSRLDDASNADGRFAQCSRRSAFGSWRLTARSPVDAPGCAAARLEDSRCAVSTGYATRFSVERSRRRRRRSRKPRADRRRAAGRPTRLHQIAAPSCERDHRASAAARESTPSNRPVVDREKTTGRWVWPNRQSGRVAASSARSASCRRRCSGPRRTARRGRSRRGRRSMHGAAGSSREVLAVLGRQRLAGPDRGEPRDLIEAAAIVEAAGRLVVVAADHRQRD